MTSGFIGASAFNFLNVFLHAATRSKPQTHWRRFNLLYVSVVARFSLLLAISLASTPDMWKTLSSCWRNEAKKTQVKCLFFTHKGIFQLECARFACLLLAWIFTVYPPRHVMEPDSVTFWCIVAECCCFSKSNWDKGEISYFFFFFFLQLCSLFLWFVAF